MQVTLNRFRFSVILTLITLAGLTGCAVIDTSKDPVNIELSSFDDLDGWDKDNHALALDAFKISCEEDLLKKPSGTGIGPRLSSGRTLAGTALNWQEPCQSAVLLVDREKPVSQKEAKAFFEEWFLPWQVRAGSNREGLFTGYYEPLLIGSRTQQRSYQTPLLNRPDDLVMVQLGEFREDLQGRRIAGRVLNGKLKPFETRAQIEQGLLPEDGFDPIVWIDDPIDAFFLHIQGSGQVVLEDETIIRVGYAGQNGHPYYAIGRELVKRGALSKNDVTLETIQTWLRANPDQMQDVLNTNASYIFFRELEKGPLGAQGVVLTPGRSLAIDYTKLPYGAPIWVETDKPAEGFAPIRRLMVAQDTGGAIRGAVRGDIFWGAGVTAKKLAGEMKAPGEKWILLPKSVQ